MRELMKQGRSWASSHRTWSGFFVVCGLATAIGTGVGCRRDGRTASRQEVSPAVVMYLAEGEELHVHLPGGERAVFRHVPPSVHQAVQDHPDLQAYLYASMVRGHLVEWEETAGAEEPSVPRFVK